MFYCYVGSAEKQNHVRKNADSSKRVPGTRTREGSKII